MVYENDDGEDERKRVCVIKRRVCKDLCGWGMGVHGWSGVYAITESMDAQLAATRERETRLIIVNHTLLLVLDLLLSSVIFLIKGLDEYYRCLIEFNRI